jgi:hypothetical protein
MGNSRPQEHGIVLSVVYNIAAAHDASTHDSLSGLPQVAGRNC